ncbi:MAG: DUF4091 domain-containing protein [Chloroflexi bacterium]|jgi:hypothetical protein|nr:DUF4091 domain-containing protein [Chloroflexota bacterium]
MQSWVTSSLVRHFPSTPAQAVRPLSLDAALNEQVSFQVAMRQKAQPGLRVRLAVDAPAGWFARVRRVGYVPVRHLNTPVEADQTDVDGLGQIPGYVPDPLFDEDTLFLPANETHAFWVTVRPGAGAEPGPHTVRVTLLPEKGAEIAHDVQVRLYDVALAPRRDFAITHWFYTDALIDWYRTELFDERFWQIVPRYMRDVVEHGQDTLYVPVFTPPLDGVKRPSQLLHVTCTGPDTYAFDWRDVKRYVDLAKRSGVSRFEWCHFFTQWGAKYAIRIYEGQGQNERLLWDPTTPATSDTYRAFLTQYLPELRRFLEEEGIAEQSFFHVSDEPHGEEHLQQYREDRAFLRELAPWIKVMDALTEIEFARQGLTDMPIPSISTALDFVREGIPCWCYYCCGPRGKYLNRLLDTPLPKIAMHGLLFYHWPFQGFLHWGYNYWYQSQTRNLIDPYCVQDGLAWERGWAYGDPFMVYPGPDGPVDSMRWEVFGESLQDYALLQTLGIRREDERLAAIVSFEEFPKMADWRWQLRAQLLSQAAQHK